MATTGWKNVVSFVERRGLYRGETFQITMIHKKKLYLIMRISSQSNIILISIQIVLQNLDHGDLLS